MPVFISYSHEDEAFVDRLFGALVHRNVQVWLDRVELKIGDSLMSKIQKALEQAPALLVVLSMSSVKSDWCKKELNAVLVRELEEKKVLVLPILIEKCEIPLFLREKVYADFTHDFDRPLEKLLSSLAEKISVALGRGSTVDYTYDWALDWIYENGLLTMKLMVVTFSKLLPYSVLIDINIRANERLSNRYLQYIKADLEWVGRLVILDFCAQLANDTTLSLMLRDSRPANRKVRVRGTKSDLYCDVIISARRLGMDTGNDVFLHINAIYDSIQGVVRQNSRDLTTEESERMKAIVSVTP